MTTSKTMFSVGTHGTSYFLNMAKQGGLYKYTLCKVKFPEKIHWKVAVNKTILAELKHMSKKRALNYCDHLMQTRKKISMGDRGEQDAPVKKD